MPLRFSFCLLIERLIKFSVLPIETPRTSLNVKMKSMKSTTKRQQNENGPAVSTSMEGTCHALLC